MTTWLFRDLNDICFRFNDQIEREIESVTYDKQPVLRLMKAERHPRADENE